MTPPDENLIHGKRAFLLARQDPAAAHASGSSSNFFNATDRLAW
jgi:hypothetical protein